MRPDYSGRWRFLSDASKLDIEDPDGVEFLIQHKEPAFHLERTLIFEGERDTFEIDLTIGADVRSFSRDDARLRSLLRWDGDQLLFVTKILRNDEEAKNLVRYILEEDGKILIADEHFHGSDWDYHNRWVFEKIVS